MAGRLKILGIAGSLRKDSYNKALIRAAVELTPDEAEIEIFDIADVPLYNQDLEAARPPIVAELKNKIENADAILFATPEYNYSVPGVFKNAIDWASRPYGDNSWDGKPAAIMGASMGILGTARAQYHLRQVCVSLNLHLLNHPEVLVSSAKEKFDKDGKLIDEKTREKIRELLIALIAWTKRLTGK